MKSWQEKKKQKKSEKSQEPLIENDNQFQGYNQWNFAELPIQIHKQEILYCIQNYSCTIIVAETGSGKTTKIPQYLIEAGYAINGKKICVSQPRRIAAISVAQRVSLEMGCKIGEEIGYSVRFDNNFDNDLTLVKFMTDGMLINEIMLDPLLSDYSVVMIDDIHERTINTDIILSLLKKIRRKNTSLKLIISSATLDGEEISNFFQETYTINGQIHTFQSKILYVEGRMFPVDIYYMQQPCKNYILQSISTALDIIKSGKEGDILIFLTCQQEIDAFIELFIQNINEKQFKTLKILPLYAGLPQDEQMEIFKPIEGYLRKMIVSTNIAESSITIDGIVFVIDTLYHKINYFDYKKGLENLIVFPISKSCAQQRAGRAGRVKKGECYRLCTQEEFNGLYMCSTPEILRCKLSNFILQIKTLGVGDVSNFELITQPNQEAYAKALEELYAFKIIDKQCNLTQDLGQKITEFALDTHLGVLLLNSFRDDFACSEEILILCSMLSLQGQIFYSGQEPLTILKVKKKLGAKEGDHITLINIFLLFKHIKNQARRQDFCFENKLNVKSMNMALKIYEQLTKQVKALKIQIQSSADDIEAILRCLVTAYFCNAAQLQADGCYRNLRNKETLYIHPTSILNTNPPNWVVYSEVVYTSKYYMREISEIDPKWLIELAGHYFDDQRVKQAEKKHGDEIQIQNEFQIGKEKNNSTFQKRKGIDLGSKQKETEKKIKVNLPYKQYKPNALSFADEDDI